MLSVNHLICLFLSFLLQTVVGAIFGDIFSKLGCILAANQMHTNLLNGILRAPNSYFDQTPNGRILSRFSQDLKIVDNDFGDLLADLIYGMGEVIPRA